MPRFIAILTFIAIEWIFLVTMNNLEIGFLPAVGGAFIAWAGTGYLCKLNDQKKDCPPALSFNMPPPKAYAVVKKAIKRFPPDDGARFKIQDDDRTDLTINAICEWKEKSEGKVSLDASSDGFTHFQLVLDVSVKKNQVTNLTDVLFNWGVISPATRGRANMLQASMTRAIKDALTSAETKTPDSAIVDEDDD